MNQQSGKSLFLNSMAFARRAWEGHWRLFLGVMLTVFAGWVLLRVAVVAGQRLGFPFWFSAHLIFFFFFAGVQVGFMRMGLDLYDGKTPAYRDTFAYFRLGPALLLGQIIYFTATLVGLVLLLVPGLYVAVSYVFFPFVVAEDEQNLLLAGRKSTRLTDGRFWQLQAILVFLLLLNVAGASILGLGLLITVPFTVLIMAALYRKLNI